LVLAVVLLAVAIFLQQALSRTPLDDFVTLALPPLRDAEADPDHPFRGLRATFLGVSTILLDDGQTAIMTDGFFSRPSLWELVLPGSTISPNRAAVEDALRRARVSRLAAVVPVHSHYDHALDAPLVAELTGAVVLGSESTANIARGFGLPESQIVTIPNQESLPSYKFGEFTVSFVLSKHSARPVWEGIIEEPLVPPAPAGAYQMGECYSIFIHHERLNRTILVQASPNFVPGALRGRHADVVFLGSTGLHGWRESSSVLAEFRDAYWGEVVLAVGARRVLPVHWDDFVSPLTEPLQATPAFIDDFGKSMAFLRERGGRDRVDVRFPVVFEAVDPFAGL